MGASVGIAIGGGGRVTIDTLIRDADAALYQAKETAATAPSSSARPSGGTTDGLVAPRSNDTADD